MPGNFKTIFATALALASLHGEVHAFSLLSFGAGVAAHTAYTHHKDSQKAHSNTSPVDVRMPAATGNFGGCQQNFANGTPPIVKDVAARHARALCFDGFAVMHSGSTKTPIYAAEVLNRSRVQGAKGEQRTEAFFADARLTSSERASLEDYAGSGFDRGHNSPAGDQDSPKGMAQSYSLANIMPQAPKNNRVAWFKIEKRTRKYAERALGNVYVITGSILLPGQCPSFDPYVFNVSKDCKIGKEVTVPSHIYKLVYDASTNRAWAHWIQNTDNARISPPISYGELVKRTGIEFLPGIHPKT